MTKGSKTLDQAFKLHSESLHDCSGGYNTPEPEPTKV